MGMYCSSSDITVFIDAINLARMTNDYPSDTGNTTINTTILNSVISIASNACDSFICSIYPTPYAGNIPAKLHDASIIFSCEALYARRLTPDKINPFKARADVWREELMKIGAGDKPLDVNFIRSFPPIVSQTTYNRANTNFF